MSRRALVNLSIFVMISTIVATICLSLAAIWIGDIRFARTAFLAFCVAIAAGFAVLAAHNPTT